MNIVIFDAKTGEAIERPLTLEEIADIEESFRDSASEAEPVTIVNNFDLWSRMTDEEADMVGGAIEQQPFRIRKIFESASTFRSDHELWPLLEQIATTLFGEGRAAEILSPST